MTALPPRYQLSDDGGRSRNDYVTRPIAAHVLERVYQANRTGAMLALKEWHNRGIVINLCEEPIDHDHRVDNSLHIPDSKAMTVEQATAFISEAVDKIETLLQDSNCTWLIVNCQAGVNRSSAALVGWLIKHRHMRFSAAVKVIQENKKLEAKRLRFKNRYQSYEEGRSTKDDFSWPTLSGRSATSLKQALRNL